MHTPGGSSSGSAAAVAAKLAPVALGTQTNGSIIRPASYCGIVGFKPSLGVLPRTGVLRHATLIDHPGVMARTVSDAALIVDAIAGEDPHDALSRNPTASMLDAALGDGPVPRLAYALGPFEARAEPATREAFAAFIANLPVRVDAIELGPEFAAAEATLRDLMCAGVAESLGPDIDSASAKVPELVVQLVRAGRALSGADVIAAWTRRDRLRASLIERVSDYDAVLTFAAAGPAPLAIGRHRRSDLRHPMDAGRRASLQPAAHDRRQRLACRRTSRRRAGSRSGTDPRGRVAHARSRPMNRRFLCAS